MKKVYCGNCKYYWCANFIYGGHVHVTTNPHRCLHRSNELIMHNPICQYETYSLTADVKNKNNDCQFYTQKWYKFWVK